MTTDKITRRSLGGIAAAGVSLPLLAACGGKDPQQADDPGAGAAGSPGSGPASGQELAKTSDIEVGGGRVFPDQQVVVTQPTAGEFKCFTAICSHQGCLVANVSGGTINCDCHGSEYSIENGDVEQGPATFPLAEIPITVSGDEITLA
jgi:Rieske Fe-S protein